MKAKDYDDSWQCKLLQPRLPWQRSFIRPAEIAEGLCDAMLDREHLLEDVNYNKIVPNRFIVDLNRENYTRNYQPLEERILKQWSERMLEHLLTTNSRQGRMEYRFGGSVQVEIRLATDLTASQARIWCRVHTDNIPWQASTSEKEASLAILSTGQRWILQPGINRIGRDHTCEVFLDIPEVQEKRLVSGQHAYIRSEGNQYCLFDGSPAGKPSLNGTFVNQQRVPSQGYLLQDSDLIILASLVPENPSPHTPGVVVLRFNQDRS